MSVTSLFETPPYADILCLQRNVAERDATSALRVFEQGATHPVQPQDEPFPRTVREAAVCEALCAGHHGTFLETHTHLGWRSSLCVAHEAGNMFGMRFTQIITLYAKVLTLCVTGQFRALTGSTPLTPR